ncbi:hypothetical protein OQJ18_03380 [Fluoribacter dumoffii]|uniref:hypothetical protein n=1 Tax=Fluoribacter dumoffii TaxID=463 RepID=UPI002242C697|nr:hypothetical protein [Fluoribacter dumoffii]MCW8418876.1 hypothetical protein [Fluoribacter dumoffii]MCW8453280.1 hypothetical protein [Fluoribacter dumoffii]MCW8459499.1 hypothetical protein [Fluoribacter dumoffii]MCW8482859.1 hypothetical protein [Fluoribacter dumoffii]
MPRTSCIPHPESERLLLIRKWQLNACGKAACAAALLNLFEYWHNIKLEQKSQAQSYNEVAQRHGDNSSQIETLLQWHTSEQLESSLLNIFNKRRIQKAIEILENLKFISIHRNPNPRYSFDKTRFFLFHPNEVCAWLNDYSAKKSNVNESESFENIPSMMQNDQIDSDNLHLSISENCTHDDYKSDLPEEQIASTIGANCPQQYTKNTYQDYLQKLPTQINTCFEAFSVFWDKWVKFTNKPVNKKKSSEIFTRIVKSLEDPLMLEILDALEKQKQEKDLRQRLNLFVAQWPDPSSWLKEARWEDEVYLDEAFYQSELLRRNSGLIQNKQVMKQQRECYLDVQYKSSVTRNQDKNSNDIANRHDAIQQFNEEFRSRRRSS